MMSEFRTNNALCASLLIVIILAGAKAMASSGVARQESQFQLFEQAVEMYRAMYGTYPPIEHEGESWYELLVNRHILSPEPRLTGDGRYPLDVYGNPIIYEIKPVGNSLMPVFRSPGENRIDEAGYGDDWDTRYGPRWGHWHKQNYPRAVWCGVIAALVLGCLAIYLRQWPYGIGILIIATGLTCIVVPLVADKYLFSSARTAPRLLEHVVVAGALFVLIGLVFCVNKCRNWVMSPLADSCEHCGYSTIGLPDQVCPECGRTFERTHDDEQSRVSRVASEDNTVNK